MPLFSMSPNIQESESASRKRTHDEYVDGAFHLNSQGISSENCSDQKSVQVSTSAVDCLPKVSSVPTITMSPPLGSLPASSPGALTDAGSSTPRRNSPSPDHTPTRSPLSQDETSFLTNISTPDPMPKASPDVGLTKLGTSVSSSSVAPSTSTTSKAPKRKLTPAEKEERERERVEKKQKRDAEAAEKKQNKEAEAAEKEQRERERIEKKQKREAEAAEKDAKRRKKEEEELAAQKKQRKQQGFLQAFVKRAPATPSKSEKSASTNQEPSDISSSPLAKGSKPEKSAYERQFQPFFVKPGVTLAPTPFEMDAETKKVKSDILDQYIKGERGTIKTSPLNPNEVFQFAFPQDRGIIRPSVKEIMEVVNSDPFQSESQAQKLSIKAQDGLDAIPMKYLKFYEDVRPPYIGTMTTQLESNQLRHLARCPNCKILPLTYDYDSEAEWQEDDGEDIDECDDDEDDEVDEEMDDLIDDSEDGPTASRPTFGGDTEPISTGICFQDEKRMCPCPSVYKYRLEVLNENLEHHYGIDPFSTNYWPQPVAMPPPPMTPGAIALINSVLEASNYVPKHMMKDFKQALVSTEFRSFTKATVTETLAKKFPSCTKTQIKATIDKVAHRVAIPGGKKTDKEWEILPAFAAD
ncbi:chromatin assembly factor 1 subunit A-domain-containing protein [Xylariomycetidae sp. FL2044]|nr:chromatin assembly factor 1 subunit A-domain-containing protein [Xylariomycetidae sp. FL2044]